MPQPRDRILAAFLMVAGFGLLVGTSGCAIHYENPRTGAEHLWGLGQLQLQADSTCTNWVAVRQGLQVPGVCLDVGRNHFGLSLGLVERHRLQVVPATSVSRLSTPTNQVLFISKRSANGKMRFGHIVMRGLDERGSRYAVITGQAMAGLCAGIGDGTRVGVGFDTRQIVRIPREDVIVKCHQIAPRWPGFDLFSAEIEASQINFNQDNKD